MIDLSLLEDFVMGAGESLEEMEAALLSLESTPNDNELLNTIFRAIHTIKGAAQFVGLEKASALSHALEDLLDLLREGKKQATLEIIEILIQAKDRINLLVNDLERSQTEETEVDDLIAKLNVHLGIETAEETEVDDKTQALINNKEEEADISSFLSNDEESIDLNTFLPDEDISSFLSEEDTPSFLLDDTSENSTPFLPEENISSFLPQENESESISDFLSETNENIDSFLPEENEKESISDFLSETNENESISDFLSETNESESISNFLSETNENIEKDFSPFIETEVDHLTTQISTNEELILPEEEYDQELFGIFISQLQEKFTFLKDFTAQLKTTYNKKELLVNIIQALENLKFSSNYMVYEELTHFYGGWINKVSNSQEDLAITEDVSFSYMEKNLLRLQDIFPQLKNIETKDKDIEQDLSQAIAINSLDAESVKNRILGELTFVNDLEPTNPTVDISNGASNTKNTEDDLFNRLSSALDVSMIEQSITSEPINEVFGALLNSTEKQRTQLKATKEKKSIIEVKTLAEANKTERPKIVEIPKQQKTSVDTNTAKSQRQEKTEQPILQEKNNKKPIKAATSNNNEKVFKKSIRVDADKIDSLMNQVGELIVDRAYFFQLATEISELQQYLKESGLGQKDLKPVRTFAYRFSEAIISLGRTSNELQEGVMKVRMLPMAQIFNRFPRLVHDVANTNNKKVNLEVRGEETELDKMIIEEVADPLMHMIRNAIGHGIELPKDRLKAGKPETGTLVLEAYHESNHIVIEVTDDGRGIDIERIKIKAEQMELFTKEELDRMGDNDLTRFIMMPGFSTAKEISSTSGRGVGMDVVKKNIEKLNGTIDVESKIGVETKMRLKIPLTLAIIPALLVKVGIDSSTIPLANVEETLRVNEDDVSIMEETEVMYLRGKTVPIFRLATLFSIESDNKIGSGDFFVVIVNTGTQTIGLMVDALIGQEEVVIKPLADYLHEKNCFSGATIIGDGRISLILDIYELINMTTDKQIKKHRRQEQKSFAGLENEG